MLAIKLKMVGRRNQRTFRVIVQEARAKLGGNFVDDLGWYNPHTNQFKVNKERADYWIGEGAQPTESVKKLLNKVQNSETTTYETREGRKKNKGPKAEGADSTGQQESDEAPTQEGEAQAEESPTDAPEEGALTDTTKEESEEKSAGEPEPKNQQEETKPEVEKTEEPKDETPTEESKEEEVKEEKPEEASEDKPVEEEKEDK